MLSCHLTVAQGLQEPGCRAETSQGAAEGKGKEDWRAGKPTEGTPPQRPLKCSQAKPWEWPWAHCTKPTLGPMSPPPSQKATHPPLPWCFRLAFWVTRTGSIFQQVCLAALLHNFELVGRVAASLSPIKSSSTCRCTWASSRFSKHGVMLTGQVSAAGTDMPRLCIYCGAAAYFSLGACLDMCPRSASSFVLKAPYLGLYQL